MERKSSNACIFLCCRRSTATRNEGQCCFDIALASFLASIICAGYWLGLITSTSCWFIISVMMGGNNTNPGVKNSRSTRRRRHPTTRTTTNNTTNSDSHDSDRAAVNAVSVANNSSSCSSSCGRGRKAGVANANNNSETTRTAGDDNCVAIINDLDDTIYTVMEYINYGSMQMATTL